MFNYKGVPNLLIVISYCGFLSLVVLAKFTKLRNLNYMEGIITCTNEGNCDRKDSIQLEIGWTPRVPVKSYLKVDTSTQAITSLNPFSNTTSLVFLKGSTKYICADGISECFNSCCGLGSCIDPTNLCDISIKDATVIIYVTCIIFSLAAVAYWIIYGIIGIKYMKKRAHVLVDPNKSNSLSQDLLNNRSGINLMSFSNNFNHNTSAIGNNYTVRGLENKENNNMIRNPNEEKGFENVLNNPKLNKLIDTNRTVDMTSRQNLPIEDQTPNVKNNNIQSLLGKTNKLKNSVEIMPQKTDYLINEFKGDENQNKNPDKTENDKLENQQDLSNINNIIEDEDNFEIRELAEDDDSPNIIRDIKDVNNSKAITKNEKVDEL